MRFDIKYLTVAIGFVYMMTSCGSGGNNPLANKPTAMGKINKIVILTDKETSEGPIGDTLLYYFESAYPILPAEEPMFDVRFMVPEELNAQPLKRELRTFVIVADLSDTLSSTTKLVKADMGTERFNRALTDTSFTTSVGAEKWAKDQIIVYLFANGEEKLAQAISKNFPAIAKRINLHDQKNLSATVFGIQNENRILSQEVMDSFGLVLQIPGLYNKAMSGPNFLWLRMDTKDVNQSLVFRKYAYKDTTQFTQENIIALRNEYGKEFIKTGFEDAYMSTNVIDLPIFEYTYRHNGIYTKEVRGIWETVNDFMGGPFVSYVLHNEAKGEIVFIDAFVFAPGKNKRDYIQQLDCIVKTATFPTIIKN